MSLEPNEEQALLCDMVTRFLADHVPPAGPCHAAMPVEDWQALGELGLLALAIPEESGGLGGGSVEIALVSEALGRAAAMTPMAEGPILCGLLLSSSDNADLRSTWLDDLMTGRHLVAYAGAGDVTVERNGQGWSLSGDCLFVRHGASATAYIVDTSDLDLGPIVLNAETKGLTVTPYRIADGETVARLRFDRIPVAESTRLNVAPAAIQRALSLARLAIAAEMVGLMQRLYDDTIEYVRQRRQFGVAIGTFQVVQHRAARLFIMIEQARSMMLRAAFADQANLATAVLEAYAYVADVSLRLAQDATQLHGGMGVTDELLAGRGHRRILVLSHLFGGAVDARSRLAALP